MALSKKCSCCGYKFKKHDGGICPECFTSRAETMSCEDLPEEFHSHEEYSYMDNEKSDMQKQLELERFESEKEELQRTVSSFDEGNGPTGNRSTNFGPAVTPTVNSTSGKNRQTSFTSKNTTTYVTTKNGTTKYTTTYSTSDAKPLTTFENVKNAQRLAKKNEKRVRFVLFLFILIFIISFALPVIFAFMGMKYSESRGYDYGNYVGTDYYNNDDYIVTDKIPENTRPQPHDSPYFPRYNELLGGEYTSDMAVIPQGEGVKFDDISVEIMKPCYIPVDPLDYADENSDYINEENKDDFFLASFPVLLKNHSTERLMFSDFNVCVKSLYIDGNGEIYSYFESYPLAIGSYLDGYVWYNDFEEVNYCYIVPADADYYTVEYVKEFNGNPEYLFCTDFTCEQVING